MKYNPAIHHRRSIRLKGYDYSQAGLYFVTICVQNRQCVFGKIVDNEMILNENGQIAYNEWMKTPDIRSNVQLDAFVVMPNHVHGILLITNVGRGVSHTPDVLHTPDNETGVCTPDDNRGVCTPILGVCDTPLRSPSGTVGAIVRGYKSAVSKQIGYSVWQRNYWEHIIRDEQSYQNIANYIANNPVKWGKDKFYLE